MLRRRMGPGLRICHRLYLQAACHASLTCVYMQLYLVQRQQLGALLAGMWRAVAAQRKRQTSTRQRPNSIALNPCNNGPSHENGKAQQREDEHANRRQDVGQLRHEIGGNLHHHQLQRTQLRDAHPDATTPSVAAFHTEEF